MGPKPFPHRTLRVSLRVLFLLGAGPATGAAQATGGFTTALAMATEAAVRAVTTTVYPVGLYAGRDGDGIPRYIQRPFSDEERRLLREHFGIEEPSRLYLSDTTTEALSQLRHRARSWCRPSGPLLSRRGRVGPPPR